MVAVAVIVSAVLAALGHPISGSRRADAERFFDAESEQWWREHNPYIIQAEPEPAEC